MEVAIKAPKVQDERTKEILRELAKLNPEDPRAEIWTKVCKDVEVMGKGKIQSART